METEKIIERANKAITDAFNNGSEFTQKRLIEKACKIYRQHLIKFNPTLKEFPTALDEAVNIFRKQLEE